MPPSRLLLPLVLPVVLPLALLGAPPAGAQEATPAPSASPSTSPSPAPAPAEPLLTGTIDGTDGRAVNALLGFDWKDAQGRTLHRSGCVQDRDTCSFAGYGTVLRVNPSLPASGTSDTATATTSWSVQPPPGARRLFLEVYPQNERLRTDNARYGHSMRHSVPLPHDGPMALRLPLGRCDEGGRVGTVRGTATKDGQPFPLRRVLGWSLEAYHPVTRPVLGWGIGTASEDGTFVLPHLAADQRYQVWVTAADGTVSKTFGVVPPACGEASLSLSFDPPPAAPVTPPAPPAPTLLPAVAVLGQPVVVEGVVAREGQPVELLAGTPGGPSRVVRSAVAGPNGRYTFSVLPQATTALRVRTAATATEPASPDGAASLVQVRSRVSAAYAPGAPRTLRVSGGVRPDRASDVLLYLRTADGGRRLLATARAGADGRYAFTRRFAAAGTFDLFVATRGDAANAQGTSPVARVRVP